VGEVRLGNKERKTKQRGDVYRIHTQQIVNDINAYF